HAQTVALQSQINPHFLYNTLDTINWLAISVCRGRNKVSQAISMLGDMFKINIDTSDYLTIMRNEQNFTKR
ncbi:MAG: histidine kinase, partial [Oscillospiraceae bacterium]